MAWYRDDWDPDDKGYIDVGYDIVDNKDGTYSFTRNGVTGGSHYRYENKNYKYKNELPYLFWDRFTGDIYYPVQGQSYSGVPTLYKKLGNTESLDLNTTGDYASDEQLNKYAEAIMKEIQQAAVLEEIKNINNPIGSTNTESTNIPSSISSVAVPNSTYVSTELQARYQENLAKASLQLQQMINSDSYTLDSEDNTIYYKYGQHEIDLDYYLHNLGTNLQAYLDSKKWNSTLKEAFLLAYEEVKNGLSDQLATGSPRFSTNDAGITIDEDGIIAGQNNRMYIDAEGNIYNSLDEIQDKKLRKTAKLFSPNDEVGKYLKTIGNAIVKSGKVKQNADANGDFDLTKHGFINFFNTKYNPSGGEFNATAIISLDPVNPEGKRERTNRTKYLAHQLQNYYNYILNSSLKFNNSNFKSKDNYLAAIQGAITNLNNGWDDSDLLSLQQIGVNSDFYDMIMTQLSNPKMTDAEAAAELENKKAEAASKYIDDLEAYYNKYKSEHPTVHYKDNSLKYNANPLYEDTTNIALDITTKLHLPTDVNNLDSNVTILLEYIKDALRTGKDEITINGNTCTLQEALDILLPAWLRSFKTSASGIKYFDDPDHDNQTGSVLCLKDGELYYDFIENVKECTAWLNIKANFEKNYIYNDKKPLRSFDKKGGVLKKLQEGGQLDLSSFSPEEQDIIRQAYEKASREESDSSESVSTNTHSLDYVEQLLNQGYTLGLALKKSVYGEREDSAKARGMSYELYNAKQQSPNGRPNFYNQDSGKWTSAEYNRLAAMALDISSLVMDPVLGTGTNLASTFLNTIADWNDDSVSTTEKWKNLAMNIGLDALSIVPIIGDAAGTGTKLLKTAKYFAPKLMYALSAYGAAGTIKNLPNIMDSLSKVMSDEKLTVGDWLNIAQAISTVAGGNNLFKAKVAKHQAKKNAKIDDAIGLGLRKGNGPKQDFIFRGDSAKKIKELVDKGNVAELETYIKSLEGFENYTVNTSLISRNVEGHFPIGRTTGSDGKKSWEIRSPFSVKRKIDHFDIYDSNELRSGYASRTLLNTERLNEAIAKGRDKGNAKTKAEVDAMLEEKLQTEVFDSLEKNKARREARAAEDLLELNGRTLEDGTHQKGLREKAKEAKTRVLDLNTKIATYENTISQAKTKKYDVETGDFDGTSYNVTDKNSIEIVNRRIDNTLSAKKGKKAKLEKDYKNAVNAEVNATPGTKAADKAKTKRENLEKDLNNLNSEIQLLETKKLEIQAHEKLYKEVQEAIKLLHGDINAKTEEGKTGLLQTQTEAESIANLLSINIKKLEERRKRLIGEGTNRTGVIPSRQKTKLLNLLNTGTPFEVQLDGGYTRTVSDMIDRLNNYYKRGGTISKFSTGNILEARDKEWLRDFIKKGEVISDEAKTVYGYINKDTLQKYNDMQIAYYNTFGNWRNPKDNVDEFQGTEDYQKLFAENAKELATSRLGSIGKGHNSTHTNNVDGLAGTRTWLSHLGKNLQDAEFINNSKILGEGIEAYYDDDALMVLFREKGTTKGPRSNNSASSPNSSSALTQLRALDDIEGVDSDDDNSRFGDDYLEGEELNPDSKKWALNPKLNANLLRAIRLGKIINGNARRTQAAIDAEKPVLKQPVTSDVLVHSSLPDEAMAALYYAMHTRPMETAITSDGAMQLAAKELAHVNATRDAAALMQKSSNVYRETQEKDRQQRKENATNIANTAAANIAELARVVKNKADIWNAGDAKRSQAIDTALQELLLEAKEREAKIEALQENAIQNKIGIEVQNDPAKYGVIFNNAEEVALAKYKSQGNTSGFSQAEKSALQSADNKIKVATSNALLKYYGVSGAFLADPSLLSSYEEDTTVEPILTTPSAKQGTKLKIEKIREKVKNADRFLKSIHKQMDNLDKQLARISKSMRGPKN